MLLTIECSGRVLDLFTSADPEHGVTEVAKTLGMSKSKAHDLLASLAEVGLLSRTDRGRYRLGWRVMSLNQVLADTTEFRCHARPVMETLCAHLGVAVQLGVLCSGRVVYVDRLDAARGVRIGISSAGATVPAHCTAVGKALLAHLDESALDDVIATHGLPAMTERTVTDARDLRAELHEIRLRGCACEGQEAMTGVSCVAAPIVGAGGAAVAALGIAAASERFDGKREMYQRAVIRAVRYVSGRLRAAECHDSRVLAGQAA